MYFQAQINTPNALINVMRRSKVSHIFLKIDRRYSEKVHSFCKLHIIIDIQPSNDSN